MKILSASARNFASYKDLDFKFDNQGLTLISGPTGSGKSTLCDLIPWVLYGTTAKNGAADDVRSWNSQGETSGRLELEVNGKPLIVRRTRFPNDLCYFDENHELQPAKRGKDLADTQKQINQLLGVNVDTYLAGSYLHEFSPTAQFFSSSAKTRRQTTEELADLSLATMLTTKLSAYNKDLKKDIQQTEQQTALKNNTIQQLEKTFHTTSLKSDHWLDKHETQVTDVENKFLNHEQLKEQTIQLLTNKRIQFDQDVESKLSLIKQDIKNTQAQIKPDSYFEEQAQVLDKRRQALGSSTCKECGGKTNSQKHQLIDKDAYKLDKLKSDNSNLHVWIISQEASIKQLEARINPYTEQIEAEKHRENTYLPQLTALREETNPYSETKEQLEADIRGEIQILSILTQDLEDLKIQQSDSELLTQVINDFRSELITRTVTQLEESTNKHLETHFDAEIRIQFDVQASDKLDVLITKDGNSCSYTQLSKGQRQLLKLCFGVSVMKAISNHSGTDFNCIFLDECTDGLDEGMKVKTFNLLSSLESDYESIFLVEHSEALKSCFNRRFSVESVEGNSIIHED